MDPHKSEEIQAYAKWLTRACQEAGLDAAQYGAEILIQGASGHLSERIICGSDELGETRWFWSWGRPITDLHDSSRVLTPDDVDELVEAISKVVSLPLRRQR